MSIVVCVSGMPWCTPKGGPGGAPERWRRGDIGFFCLLGFHLVVLSGVSSDELLLHFVTIVVYFGSFMGHFEDVRCDQLLLFYVGLPIVHPRSPLSPGQTRTTGRPTIRYANDVAVLNLRRL